MKRIDVYTLHYRAGAAQNRGRNPRSAGFLPVPGTQVLKLEWRQAEADRKARERAAHLACVAKRSQQMWAEALALRDSPRSSAPKQAAIILVDLAHAADASGIRAEFDAKLAAFAAPLNPIRTLHKHLVAAGLVRK